MSNSLVGLGGVRKLKLGFESHLGLPIDLKRLEQAEARALKEVGQVVEEAATATEREVAVKKD